MKQKFIDRFNAQDMGIRFNRLPRRIFLDTNVLQYLQDFGEYIFDNCREYNEYFISPKGEIIDETHPLYLQIVALHDILINISRTNLEFALSQSVFREVVKRRHNGAIDGCFLQWFYEMWDYWQSVLENYEDNPIVSKGSFKKYKKAQKDNSFLCRLSQDDQEIVLDAIYFDCDGLLTVDKFAHYNFQYFAYERYGIMILKPTDLLEILKPFQALWV